MIGPDKTYLLETRLAPILKREQLRDLNALAERLRGAGGRSAGARRGRGDDHQRELLLPRRQAVPAFPHAGAAAAASPRARAGAPLRIWSAASSSGQEAYSLAMILAECRAALGDRRVEIIGTDIARDQLARARDGVYTQFEVQRGLPVQMLMRYFRKEDAGWRISDAIRGMVQFREWNLLGDLRPLGRFDVVFCRNVLIYFDQPTKTRVLEAIARQMAPDGVLYLGGAETVLGITSRFAPLAGERGVYGLAGAGAVTGARMAVA